MTSKKVISFALALLTLMPCVVEAGVSTAAANYYQMRLKDEPQGVYEWEDEGLLFVQVRLPLENGEDPSDLAGRVLAEEHNQLFAWLAKQSSSMREDPILCKNLESVRSLIREEDPLWEYTADWEYSFNGPHYARYEGNERVCCAVYRKTEVFKTMPKAFLEPLSADFWLKESRAFFAERMSEIPNRLFFYRIGAYDRLYLSVIEDGCDIGVWVSSFGNSDDNTFREYQDVNKRCSDYLETSSFAQWIKSEKVRLETLPDEIKFVKDMYPLSERTVVEKSSVTNQIGELEFEITEAVIQRRVFGYHKIVTKKAVDPVFEKLFCSSGTMTNKSADRLQSSHVAEAAFKSKRTAQERERLIIKALRENPGDKVMWNLLARFLMNRKDYEGAVICLRNALRLDMNYEFAWTNLAVVYDLMNCPRLSCGAAIGALGLSKDAWCRKEAERILSK